MARRKFKQSQQPPIKVDTEALSEQQKNLQRDAFSASFSMIQDIDKLKFDQPQKNFDIGNLSDISKSVVEQRQQNIPIIQPPVQRAEINQTVDVGQGLEEAVEQQKNETAQKNLFGVAAKQPIDQPIPWEEKYGVKTFFTKSAGDITSLLQQRICNVEFTRTTSPQGKRVLRCTLNPDYIPSRTSGLGNYGGLIKVWDVELNDYRSFYSTSVHKISYDENPGRRG